MNNYLAGVTKAAIKTFPFPGPVLEIGSYLVPGQEKIADLRTFLPGKEFIGTDMREGPGVDRVENVQNLSFEDESFGSVFALNVFEHVEKFWLGFEEIQRVLRPDGILMVCCPYFFHIHDYPSDYWRFTPASLQSLLSDFPQKIVGWHGHHARPLSVWAVAFGKDRPAVQPAERETFDRWIGELAFEKEKLSREIRYRIGRLICGKGPFEQFFMREKFENQFFGPDQEAREAA